MIGLGIDQASMGSGVVAERLLDLYRRYVGEPEQLSDVYIGFGLFFAGIALGAVGMAVFLWSAAVATSNIYWLREIAIAMAMLGLPSFLFGIGVLLPVDRRALYVGGLGSVICLAAVGIFVANYPGNWNTGGTDATATGVSVYAVGVVLVSATVGAALVSNYIARSAPASIDTTEPGSEGSEDESETISEERVRKDIDEALSETDISWGGVAKDDTKDLRLRMDDADIDTSGFVNVEPTENRAAGTDVNDAVSELGKLRGEETKQATGEGSDEQAAALQQLREQKAQESDSDERLFARLRNRLGL